MVLPASAQEPGQIHLRLRKKKKKKKNHLPGNHFNSRFQNGVYLLQYSLCSILSGLFQVDSFGKLYTGGVNTCRHLIYFLFLLLCHVLFRCFVFVLFPPLAITLMCFCICLLVSNFSCLLDCVFAARALGFECLCGPFPGSNPRLPPHAAKLCVWPKLLCGVWLHLDFSSVFNTEDYCLRFRSLRLPMYVNSITSITCYNLCAPCLHSVIKIFINMAFHFICAMLTTLQSWQLDAMIWCSVS